MSNTRFKQSQTDHSSSDKPKPTGRPDYWHRQALPDRTKRRTEHTNRFVEFTQRRAEFRLAYTISHSLQAKLIMHQKNLTYYPWSLLSQRHFFCAKMGITLMYKCVTLSLLKMEEATADKMLNANYKQKMQTKVEKCVNSRGETVHAWLKSLSVSPQPVIYLSEL